jgi:hypothetical protein
VEDIKMKNRKFLIRYNEYRGEDELAGHLKEVQRIANLENYEDHMSNLGQDYDVEGSHTQEHPQRYGLIGNLMGKSSHIKKKKHTMVGILREVGRDDFNQEEFDDTRSRRY